MRHSESRRWVKADMGCFVEYVPELRTEITEKVGCGGCAR